MKESVKKRQKKRCGCLQTANLPKRGCGKGVEVRRKRLTIPPGIVKKAKRAYRKQKPQPGQIMDFEA